MSTPIIQIVTLPLGANKLEKAREIYKSFADYVREKEVGCLEFALYENHNEQSGQVEIIIVERFTDAAAHKVHTDSGEYKAMMAATEQYGLLSGAPTLQGVSLIGGFNGR